jgi:DHA1 family vesicular acetylcholine transporter-like MFS transporter 3
MTQIPIINMDFNEFKEAAWQKIKEPHHQRQIILVIVCIALLLDNMLYMVIVPIIPDYLRYTGAFGSQPPLVGNATTPLVVGHRGQDSATGILFASKAIVQLMVNPFSGALIDKIGYDVPMMIGLTIIFLSTLVFACGRSYAVLFFARSLQGVGSAFADTSGLAMIADRFTEENERQRALGIALAFISFGCLVAPPFGGALYDFAGKEVPFLILAFVSLIDFFMLLLVMKPIKEQIREGQREKSPTIPIWKLFIDPYIAVCAGALMMANVALAFLEPTISLWMEDNLTKENWKIGMVWLPAFFPHVFGVVLTVKMARKYPQYQWLMALIGLVIEGACCVVLPFSSSYIVLMIPICGICFGVALIDTSLLPMLGYWVDVRYVSVYGSIYAIADISYSVAYALGPIIAGGIVEAIGFTTLNMIIALSNFAYAPVLIYLKHIYDFKHFENETNVLMTDPPDKKYQTYAMHDATSANPIPITGEVKNHLEYSRFQETNIDNENTVASNNYSTADGSNYYESHQQAQGYREPQGGYQGGGYQQPANQGYEQAGYEQGGYQANVGQAYQRPQAAQQNAAAARDTNPFRSGPPPAVPPAPVVNPTLSESTTKNPFRQGYGF